MFSRRLVDPGRADCFCEEVQVEKPDVNKSLLDLIYGADPNTGLPVGDIAMYLSDKTNPQVRQFIELNLMHENSDGKSQLSIPQDVLNSMKKTVTDDDIAYFSRGGDESREQYAVRMRKYFDDQRILNQKKRYQKELEKDLKAVRERFGSSV